ANARAARKELQTYPKLSETVWWRLHTLANQNPNGLFRRLAGKVPRTMTFENGGTCQMCPAAWSFGRRTCFATACSFTRHTKMVCLPKTPRLASIGCSQSTVIPKTRASCLAKIDQYLTSCAAALIHTSRLKAHNTSPI